MGRQICFFATPVDYFLILEHIVDIGWFFIDYNGEERSLTEIKQMIEDHYNYEGKRLSFFISSKTLKIVKDSFPNFSRIDEYCSEVIEISICSPPPPNIRGLITLPNQYESGRLWYTRQYYDYTGNTVLKSTEIDKMYNSLVRKIKKNSILSRDKFAYILPDAYRRYKEGIFIPCSGKISIIFD